LVFSLVFLVSDLSFLFKTTFDVAMQLKYYKVFKPYGMLSQFTSEAGHVTLKSLFDFPSDVYPIGRLDHDSEGLLLLTNDKSVNVHLLDPLRKHKRIYWLEVENIPNEDALEKLRNGVRINLKGTSYQTLPALCQNNREAVTS
jgi:23S rRNA pseudouridine2457 synthase